jgi:uncharacterized protein YbjT (DUF2867 family)
MRGNLKYMKIAIAAAAGNIGSRTAKKIAESGVNTILLGRDAGKLNALEINGAISVTADLSDAESVTKATAGADALLWLVPPTANYPSLKSWYEEITNAGVAAIKANDIKKVVLISSVGAGSRDDLGTVTYAGRMEEALSRLEIDFVALRPGYFMENFLLQTDLLKTDGYFSFTYAPDHDIPFISTDDIGDVTAGYLLDNSWAGKWSRNLMGPENITLAQAAETLSEVLGKPIAYRQNSIEQARQELANFGLNPTVQNELIELFESLGDPNGIYATARTYEAVTTTTFKQFVENKLLPHLTLKP